MHICTGTFVHGMESSMCEPVHKYQCECSLSINIRVLRESQSMFFPFMYFLFYSMSIYHCQYFPYLLLYNISFDPLHSQKNLKFYDLMIRDY